MFSKKGIVVLGPVFSGKTTLLQISSSVIKKCFNKTMKHSTISPQTFTSSELMGNNDENPAYYSNEA